MSIPLRAALPHEAPSPGRIRILPIRRGADTSSAKADVGERKILRTDIVRNNTIVFFK